MYRKFQRADLCTPKTRMASASSLCESLCNLTGFAQVMPIASCYNLRMSKTVTTIDQHSSVALPPEALDALGVEAGAELEVEIVGRALVVRSVEEARRSREFISAFESILSKRRTAYDELAKGPDR